MPHHEPLCTAELCETCGWCDPELMLDSDGLADIPTHFDEDSLIRTSASDRGSSRDVEKNLCEVMLSASGA